MPSYRAVRAANATFKPLYRPTAIFVGGTSGIGRGIVEAFAHHVQGNAHIIIVGRNRDAAHTILSQLPKPKGEEYAHEFVECDASRMKNIDNVTQGLLERLPKLNFLFMSQGYATMKGREETEEGLDKKLAVHYYSRWKFTNDLLPLLHKAKDAGEHAKVLSVMAAGKGGEIDLNDLGLKKTYTLQTAALQAPTYNDLMMQEFSARNPTLAFAHANPGFVRTNIASASDSALLRYTTPIVYGAMYPFTTSYQETGEYMLHGLIHACKGFYRVGSRGEDIGRKGLYSSEEARRKLWEHTEQATECT